MRNNVQSLIILTLMSWFTIVPSQAQNTQNPCSQEQARQFDFWLGEWKVLTPAGKLAGYNTIESILGGCALKESYHTESGYKGHSFNIFDKNSGQWHQTWVDNTGLLLQLDGSLINNSMVMSGPGKNPKGETVTHRISFSPLDNGVVRQHWEVSKDDGKTWTTLFDGQYHKIN